MEGKEIIEGNNRRKFIFAEEIQASSDRHNLGRIHVKGFIELFIKPQDEEKILKASKIQNRLPKSRSRRTSDISTEVFNP